MKRFIGYELSGEAADWQQKLSKELKEKFPVEKPAPHAPAHITILEPFITENLESIEPIITAWTKEAPQDRTVKLKEYSHFRGSTVFAHAEVAEELKESITHLQHTLRAALNMEHPGHLKWKPHVTLISRLNEKEFKPLVQYVSTLPQPDFELLFDNITIFTLDEENRIWNTDKVFRF